MRFIFCLFFFFFSSRRRHTRLQGDWSSDVCSSDLGRDVLQRTTDYLNGGVSFAVETNFSSHGRVDLIRRAKSRGYQVHLVFMGLDNLALKSDRRAFFRAYFECAAQFGSAISTRRFFALPASVADRKSV